MVYWPTIQYLEAAAITFILLLILGPIVYGFWFVSGVRDMVNTSTSFGKKLQFAGDMFFRMFQVLGYLIPGIIIGWGFAAAARTGTQEQQLPYDEGG